MSKLVAEEGEGCAHGYGVYGIIRDLIEEGTLAKFVDESGCYLVNWVRALDCYADYKRRKILTSPSPINPGENLAIA